MDFNYDTETITPETTGSITIGGTGSLDLPVGTTGQRPSSPVSGMMRYNSSTNTLDLYSTAWDALVRSGDAQINPNNLIIVQTNPGPGQFSSIKTAIDYVVANGSPSNFNPWVVEVKPGTYFESAFTVSVGINVIGEQTESVTVLPVDPTQTMATLLPFSSISDLTILGCNGVSGKAVYVSNAVPAIITNVQFIQNTIDIDVDSTAGTTVLTVDNGIFPAIDDSREYAIRVNGAGGNVASVSVQNSIFLDIAPNANLISTLSVTGTTAELILAARMRGYPNGNAIEVSNGASLSGSATIIGYDTALNVANTGSAPTLAISLIISGSTHHINVAHPGTIGNISGTANRTLVTIDPAAPVALDFSQNETGSGFTATGSLWLGSTFGNSTDVVDLIQQALPVGLLSGGLVTTGTGLAASVAAGYGYVQDATTLKSKRISWPTTALTLPDFSHQFIYIDNSGAPAYATTPPSYLQNIFLGDSFTAFGAVQSTPNYPQSINFMATEIDAFLKRAIGPIFGTGAITNEDTTPFQLDVSSGVYYFSKTPLNVMGATPVTFNVSYHIGGVNVVAPFPPTQTVDHAYYDDGTDLAALTTSYYVKHMLMVASDIVGSEVYGLVTGINQYATLLDAENAALPIPPPDIVSVDVPMVPIAAIIVQQGASIITEILDIRPRIGFQSPVLAGASVHGNLTGLLADDHPQYLLVAGTRALTGNLNLGTNNIINIGTANGVTIEAHASRHLPNGADPLTTAAGVTVSTATTNGVGTANSLSRSDHTHALSGVQPLDATLTALAAYNTNGLLTQTAADTFTGRTITGTSGTITVTNGNGVSGNPTLTIDSAYVGQSSITTVGTITSGTWNATTIAINHGGTGLVTTPTNGQLLIGSTSGSNYSLATLTAGTAIGVTNGAGSITIDNTGVTSIIAGSGISVSGATGDVTITATGTGVTSFSAGTTGFTPNSTTTGAITLAGTLTITNGGTGQTTKAGAYNALSPMTTLGDLEYEAAGPTAARLGIGTTGQVLTVVGGLPAWSSTPTLTGTNFTGIPNAALTNSSITIGSTSISLGASSTIIAGLSSVTSTTFVGALTGNSSSATNLAGGAAGSIPYQTGSGTTVFLTAGTGVLVGGTTPTYSTTPTLTGTNFTGIPNAGLTNSSLTVSAGTGMSGGGTVSLGGTITLTNAGVTSVAGTANQITASASTGSITLTTSSTFIAPGSVQVTTSFQTSTTNSVIAAGSTQGTATPITTDYVIVTTTGSGTGVILPAGLTGRKITIVNKGASTLLVYPAVSGTIESLGTNAAASIPTGQFSTFGAITLTQWYIIDPPFFAGTGISMASANGTITYSNTGVTSVNASGGTTGLSFSGGPVTTTGTLTLAGTLAIANGGTGQITASAAFNGLSPITTTGDLIYSSSGTTNSRLGIGSTGQVLTVVGGLPTYSSTPTLTGTNFTGIPNTGLTNSSLTVSAGTGMSGGGTVSLGGTITLTNIGVTSNVAGTGISVSGATGAVTITNIGVTSITGTTNQVIASASTGGVTLSLPQSINTGATPTFAQLTISNAPINPTDTVNLAYLQTTLSGLEWKQEAATASTVALTAAYSNGASGVGATLTNSGTQVAFTIDGYTAALNDRILIKNQVSPIHNGIYTVTTIGSGSTNWVLTRTSDANTTTSLNNATLYVTNGTTNANTGWTQTTANPAIGTNNIVFSQFSGSGTYVAGTGLTLTGNTFSLTSPVVTTLGGTGTNTTPTTGQVLVGTGSNTYTPATIASGTGISTTTGSGTLQINNTGVTSNLAGTGISVSGATGAVTITNIGVTSAIAGTGIGVSGATGAVTFSNTGVTSITGTTNQITASASTGGVTLSLPASVTITTGLTVSGLTPNSFLYSGTAGALTTTGAPTNGQLLIGSTGAAPVKATLTAGTGISVTNGAGSITIANTGVTSVGLSDGSTTPIYTISNSPITTTGTLTFTLNTQTKNTMFAGPATGANAQPTFRTVSLAQNDLSDVIVTSPTSNQFLTYNGTTWVNSSISGSSASGTISSWTLVGGNIYTGSFSHNLNTSNVVVSVYNNSTNKIIVPDSITLTDANTITITIAGNTTTVRVVVVQTVITSAVNTNIIRTLTYVPTSFDNPNNSDWIINALAPAMADPTTTAITVRQFSNTPEQGVGFILPVPSSATNIIFAYKGRAQTAQGSIQTLQQRIYTRLIPNNAALGTWSSANNLASVSVPANAFFQYYSTTVTLASLGLTAGNSYQVEFTRNISVASNLATSFLLAELDISFT